MPGWHEATKQLQQQGKIQLAGIIEEQHPDRCRLFMQWKQMAWPIMVDPINLLGVTAVPITLAIDEYGIIRMTRVRVDDAARLQAEFVEQTFPAPPTTAQPVAEPPDAERLRAAAERGADGGWKRYGDALLMWAGAERLGDAIDAYHRAVKLAPSDGTTRFALGVAYRARYDSALRREGDFQAAVSSWRAALDIDPNQYIWRRRIQQYGPRLDKPYPFYDWVPAARTDIEARGERPVELIVEPRGSEFADAQKTFASAESGASEPDPDRRIIEDAERLIQIEATAVPPVVSPGEALRLHLTLRPDADQRAHWNNEADPLTVWVDPPPTWQVDLRLHTAPVPAEPVSDEPRMVELEARCPDDAADGTATLSAYALYGICDDNDGTCRYRRQEVAIPVTIRAAVSAATGS